MNAGMTPDERAGWLRAPIVRGVMLSAALHVAVLAIIQASPGPRAPQVMVINARLQQATARTVPAQPAPRSVAASPSPHLPAVETIQKSDPVVSPPRSTALTPAPPLPISPIHAPTRDSAPVLAPMPAATGGATPRIDTLSPASATVVETTRGVPPSTLPSLPTGIDTTWYVARQVDNHPKAIGVIEPAYPDEARRRNQEGSLKLMLKIDDLGRVQSAEVVEATPAGVFDEAALAAFRAARFQPAMKDGRPVRYQAYMRVDFKLKD
jgi:periplasmic protein TonB